MKNETKNVIQQCLKFKGGRSRPDKSIPWMMPYLLQCKEILDVGCGRGSLGWILHTENPEIRVSGVEIHEQYLAPHMRQWYEMIHRADYRETYLEFFSECVVLMDVLEHFEYSKAVEIIESLKARGSRIIVSIPVAEKHWHQDSAFEKANPHEAHLYDWTEQELIDLGLRHVGSTDGLGVFVFGFGQEAAS